MILGEGRRKKLVRGVVQVNISKSGYELARLVESLSSAEPSRSEMGAYHQNEEAKEIWRRFPAKTTPVEASDIFRSAIDLNFRSSAGKRRFQKFMAERIDEPHLAVRVPIHFLSMQHDPSRRFGHPDSWVPPSNERIGREIEYARRPGRFPPIYVTASSMGLRRSRKRGWRPTLYVMDGNHRVAAAIRRGDTHINAYVPAKDWNEFRRYADEWAA